MKHSLTFPAVMLLGFFALQVSLNAQSTGTQSGQSDTNPPRVMSPPIQLLVTGCLKRDNDGGFRLKDSNGTTWKLTSKTVDLSEPLNHVVSLTGKPGNVSPPPVAENQQNDSGQSGGKVSPTLQVLTVKILSNSCTR
jgi:hypothetical protein